MMRINRDILAIVLLLLVFIAGGIFLSAPATNPSRQAGTAQPIDPSVENDRASGSEAVFHWVQAEGYQALPWRLPWSDLAQSHADFLISIDPQAVSGDAALTGDSGDTEADPTELASADAVILRQWISQGHTALLMSSDLSDGNGEPDEFAKALGVFINPLNKTGLRTEFAPLQPVSDTQGVISVHSDASARITEASPAGVPLFGDSSGPLVISREYGKGRLIVIADSFFASNSNFGQAENARFIADLLAHYAPPGSPVLFDEYHLGDSALLNGENLWTVLGRPLQLMLIQLALAGFLLIGFLGIRAGKPVPLVHGPVRTSSEYIISLAGLYQRAGASLSALDILYRTFLRDLTGRLALAPDADQEKVAEVAARRGQTDLAALRALLRECEQRLNAGKVSESELLDIVRRMERVRKDIGIV